MKIIIECPYEQNVIDQWLELYGLERIERKKPYLSPQHQAMYDDMKAKGVIKDYPVYDYRFKQVSFGSNDPMPLDGAILYSVLRDVGLKKHLGF